jgi:hypothetical protein
MKRLFRCHLGLFWLLTDYFGYSYHRGTLVRSLFFSSYLFIDLFLYEMIKYQLDITLYEKISLSRDLSVKRGTSERCYRTRRGRTDEQRYAIISPYFDGRIKMNGP